MSTNSNFNSNINLSSNIIDFENLSKQDSDVSKIGFQFMSDLHLEFSTNKENTSFFNKIVSKVPYLILAGDIGNPFESHYSNFLQNVSSKFEKIFIITGNHEYYNKNGSRTTMDKVNRQVEKIVDNYKNIVFLNNSSFLLDVDSRTIKILGTTLWSNIISSKRIMVHTSMNDYSKIYIDSSGDCPFLLKPQTTNLFHQQNIEWLKEEIDENYENIIISHHLPTYKLIDSRFEFHPLNCAFASCLDEMIKSPIKAWISGHTHYRKSMNINNVQCEVNPRGYPGENTNFDINAVLWI